MTSTKNSESRLQEIRQQLESWRNRGNQHHRTPEPVWKAAQELAPVLGTSRVARALRLNYTGLKRRLAVSIARSEPPTPAFVELKCTPPAAAAECRICLQDAAGGQMSVAMAAADATVLRELAQAFWQRSL